MATMERVIYRLSLTTSQLARSLRIDLLVVISDQHVFERLWVNLIGDEADGAVCEGGIDTGRVPMELTGPVLASDVGDGLVHGHVARFEPRNLWGSKT